MKQVDFYTGEPITGSPPSSPEAEAANMASFGKYNYDPRYRQQVQMMQPTTIYPGGYGYNYQQSQPQQQYGLGANPAFFMPPPQYPQYQPVYQQPQKQQATYTVPGYNPTGSEYLPPVNYKEIIDKMANDYWYECEVEDVKREVDTGQNGYQYNPAYGYNFYGVPYYNPYNYNSIIKNKYQEQLNEMERQAKEARRQFNIRLCEIAYAACGETDYDEAEIIKRIDGYTIEIPGVTNIDLYNQNRYENLVPFNNANVYREHFARVSAEHQKYIPKDADLEETLMDFGMLGAHYAMEEEMHRRRNGKLYYNSANDSYKEFIHQKVKERYMKEKGIVPNQDNNIIDVPDPQETLQQFPTLQQSARLSDDGTLNITCSFGPHKGEVYSVNNSMEAEYDKKRERFNAFLNSIPGSIYMNNQSEGGGG